jgi:hypothetical protein
LPACHATHRLRIPKDKERGGEARRLLAAGELLHLLQASVRAASKWVVPKEGRGDPKASFSLTWTSFDAKRDKRQEAPYLATFALEPRPLAQSIGSSFTVLRQGHGQRPLIKSFDGRALIADRQALRALLTTLCGPGATATLTGLGSEWQFRVQLDLRLRLSSAEEAGASSSSQPPASEPHPGFAALEGHWPVPASPSEPLINPKDPVRELDQGTRELLKALSEEPDARGLLFQEPRTVGADIKAAFASRGRSAPAEAVRFLTNECRKRATTGPPPRAGRGRGESRTWARQADWCRRLSFYALLEEPSALCQHPGLQGCSAQLAFEALCREFRLEGRNRQHALAYVHHLCVPESLELEASGMGKDLPLVVRRGWEGELCEFVHREIATHHENARHSRIQAEASDNQFEHEHLGGGDEGDRAGAS